MLLRLRVKNFKNLRDVDVRFGPLTCFTGPNGVGKSNIFDAIQFLRALAEHDIQTASQAVRSPAAGVFGPKELFWRADPTEPMSFTVDMLAPPQVTDDFGRPAAPATTLLRYTLALRYSQSPGPRLEVAHESLTSLKAGDARDIIGFPHQAAFRKRLVKPTRRVGPLISTKDQNGTVSLMLHQDGGSRGRPIPAGHSPRTVVGGTNAAEYPTVLAARRAMASWQLLHLEPSVMRTPDVIGGPDRITERGGCIAATLERLARQGKSGRDVFAEAANRLAELVEDLQALSIDRDEVRQQLSIVATMRGSPLPLGPRALSDGTLRFLALVTLFLDPQSCAVLCMEEPENGIHPARIPAMVSLLRDFALDPKHETSEENPARQVIINTHSPDVVRQLDAADLLFVDALDAPGGPSARVSAIEGRWRAEAPTVPIQRLVDFIGGAPLGATAEELQGKLKFGTAR